MPVKRGVRGRKSQRDRPFLCSERAYSKIKPPPVLLKEHSDFSGFLGRKAQVTDRLLRVGITVLEGL